MPTCHLSHEDLAVRGRLHDLRNYLGVIKAWSSLLATNDPGLTEVVKIICHTCDQATGLCSVNDSLTRSCDLLDVLRDFPRLQRPLLAPTGARCTIRIPEKLPPVRISPEDLARILVNLVKNAVEAHARNISLEARTGNNGSIGFVSVTIADDGQGIADTTRIFDPGFSTKPNGSGIGLSAVKHCIESFGGKIRVDSALGKGTSISILLPQVSLPLQNGTSTGMDGLLTAIQLRDSLTWQHSVRVGALATNFGSWVRSNRPMVTDIHHMDKTDWATAGMLHDIGKLSMPDTILFSRKLFSKTERSSMQAIRRHPVSSASIAEACGVSHHVVESIRYHHEAWDGTGYPDGLRGENIPTPARVLAIIDSFDAITMRRHYRPAKAHEEAMAVLRAKCGIQFDPILVGLFEEFLNCSAHEGDP